MQTRNGFGRDILNVRDVPAERIGLARIGVNAENVIARLRKHHRQRHAHISHAEDSDPGRFILKLFDEGIFD